MSEEIVIPAWAIVQDNKIVVLQGHDGMNLLGIVLGGSGVAKKYFPGSVKRARITISICGSDNDSPCGCRV